MTRWVALGVTLVSVFLPVVHLAFDLNTVPSRSIPLYGHILFTQSSVGGLFGCFCFMAVVNKAAVHFGTCVSFFFFQLNTQE